MADKRLLDLWDRLQNKKTDMPHFLEKISMTDTGIRGMYDCQVEFKYPVSVLAGGNGSGKSTVLSTAAGAYTVPDTSKGARSRSSKKRSSQGFSPFTVFPGYRLKPEERKDKESRATVSFEYLTPNGQRFAQFKCLLKISSDATQKHSVAYDYSGDIPPERSIYLITPRNFTYPSEINKFPDIPDKVLEIQKAYFRPLQMEFAQQLLPFKYSEIFDLNHPNFNFSNSKNLLGVEQENGVIYPETHMATGERAIFRLSQKIAEAKGGLVLIDEVEASLHPSLQKSLMLKLQELALCNDLQIIVTTHSPAVLDSVPPIGRIFLERDENGEILVGPAYTDLVYRALYGHHEKKFKLLCEDKVAKSILKGVFDVIIACDPPAEEESLNIQCTKDGAGDFPRYARILKELNRDFVFILDGDQRLSKENIGEKTRSATECSAQVMFLPGKGAPEEWVWERMRFHSTDLADMLDLDVNDLVQEMDKQDNFYISKVGSIAPKKIIKGKFRRFLKCAKCCKSEKTFEFCVLKICRMVSRLEAKQENSDIQPLVKQLKDAFQAWREGAEDPGETEETG